MSLCIHCELLLSILSVINAQTIPSWDKLCASKSTYVSIDGIFSNPTWQNELNGATYYNEKSSQYLFPYIQSGNRYLMIAREPIFTTVTELSYYCIIGFRTDDYIFDINDCFKQWKHISNGKDILDTNMSVVNCNDIRVTNNDQSWLNGIYIWKMFVNSYSVYYCNECDDGFDMFNGSYLHGWIYPSGSHEWRISGIYPSSSGWSACTLGFDLGSDYLFDLEQCEQWYSSNGTAWYIDDDMLVEERVPCEANISNEFCLFVDMYPSNTLPTSSTVQIQNSDDGFNTYFYIFFTAHAMDCAQPTIEFKFERIDTDSSYEYIHVINNNGSLISKCGGITSNDCGTFEQCFNDISVGVNEIKMNETYQILITESPHVDALCSEHIYSINAQLTLTCSIPIVTTEPTIKPTTKPSNTPTTKNPIAIPTIYPSEMPSSISYTSTTEPTMFLTELETEQIKQTNQISPGTIVIIVVVVVGILILLCVIVFRKRLFSKFMNINSSEGEPSMNRNVTASSNTELEQMIPPDGIQITSTDGNGETAYIG